MSTFGQDLITLFSSAGVGTANKTLFFSSKATLPSGDVLSVTDTGGPGPERTQNSVITPAYLRSNAQVVARGATHARAHALIQAAYDASVGVRNTFIGSGYYREINPIQEPFDTGLDELGRIRLTFNLTAIRRPS